MSAEKDVANAPSANKSINGHDSRRSLRGLPSVDRVMGHLAMAEARRQLPGTIVAAAARAVVDAARDALLGGSGQAPSLDEIAAMSARRAFDMTSPSLRPVINAT